MTEFDDLLQKPEDIVPKKQPCENCPGLCALRQSADALLALQRDILVTAAGAEAKMLESMTEQFRSQGVTEEEIADMQAEGGPLEEFAENARKRALDRLSSVDGGLKQIGETATQLTTGCSGVVRLQGTLHDERTFVVSVCGSNEANSTPSEEDRVESAFVRRTK